MNTKINIILLAFLILFTILFFFQLYISNDKHIKVQEYLEKIYQRSKVLQTQFQTWVRPPTSIETENGIFVVHDFLEPTFFQHLRTSFENRMTEWESMDYGLRKGTGVNFMQLHQTADYPGVLELYYSNTFLDTVSSLVQKPLQRTPLSDVNAESLLIYVNAGDHIDWHKDYSNYFGDRYVALITLVNENADKTGLSAGSFQYKVDAMDTANKPLFEKEKEYTMKMPENSFMMFKGSEILHRGTPILPGEKRILISMVFCDICQENTNIFSAIYERIKNFTFYR